MSFRQTLIVLMLFVCSFIPLMVIFPELRMHQSTIKALIIGCFSALIIKITGMTRDELGLGSRYALKGFIVGLTSGALIILSVSVLDAYLSSTQLVENELFKGSEKRPVDQHLQEPFSLSLKMLFLPVLEELFFVGILSQGLTKKLHPIIATYLTGLLFALSQLSFSIGCFLLAWIASIMLLLTRSLYSSLIFHLSCVAAGYLIVTRYPKLTTLLNFLW